MFLKADSAPDAQHEGSISLINLCKACYEWNPSWKTSVWPWPLYWNSVSVCYQSSYSLGASLAILVILILKSLESSLPWGPRWTSSSQYERIWLKSQIWTALIQDTTNCMVRSSRQKHEHDEWDMWLCMVKWLTAIIA